MHRKYITLIHLTVYLIVPLLNRQLPSGTAYVVDTN